VKKLPTCALLSCLVGAVSLALPCDLTIGRLLTCGTGWMTAGTTESAWSSVAVKGAGATFGKDCSNSEAELSPLSAEANTSARTSEIGAMNVLRNNAVRQFQRC
jgi:hypothetical protein